MSLVAECSRLLTEMQTYEQAVVNTGMTPASGLSFKNWGSAILFKATELSTKMNQLAADRINNVRIYGELCYWKFRLETEMTNMQGIMHRIPKTFSQEPRSYYH